jgi:hypothetical protein
MQERAESDETPPPGEVLERLSIFLNDVARDLTGLYRDARARGEGGTAEARDRSAELRKWALLAHEEKAKVDKLIQDRDGGGAGGAIDFGAVRVEVGRRLARLRAAADARGVPE